MRILLGMSGGLDSTYAALKLIEEGHSVEGAVLVMHDYTDLSAARTAAAELGIKLHEIDCRDLFEKKVVSDFVLQYKNGRTPNPCIICNNEVKFRALCDYAKENCFDKIATGHYAKIKAINGGHTLICRAADERKDQTYMLYRLDREIIDMLVLPLSDLTKDQVRELAEKKELSSVDSDESQEICFIPDGKYGEFIENREGKSPRGSFVDVDGNVLGEHNGIIHYTVGQRKGLGIALGKRAFITDIDPQTNRITLSFESKLTQRFFVDGLVFASDYSLSEISKMPLKVKVRYQAPLIDANVYFSEEGCAKVDLSTPAKAVTEGQSAVFYCNDAVVFGGFIRLK